MEYILDNDKHNECLFCSISSRENQKNKSTDRKNLILHRDRHCFVVLNKYPYNNGHLMIVPYFHTASFDGLSDEVLFDLIKVQKNSVDILNKVLNPDGFGRSRYGVSYAFTCCSPVDWRYGQHAHHSRDKGNAGTSEEDL
jgi:ATP adenylyltransferase